MKGVFKKPEDGNSFDRLQEIVETMQIPKERHTDLKWLARNIGTHNGQHPNLKEACDLLRKLLFIKEEK